MKGGAKFSFGLDLSGYTTGKSSLVVFDYERRYLTVIDSVFSQVRSTEDSLSAIIDMEVRALRACLGVGRVAVDIPIDLQGLLDRRPKQNDKIWNLTLRPIDRKLRAMPPLADRIGAPVMRFQEIVCTGGFRDDLGSKLFETYPVAVLRACGLDPTGYKAATEIGAERRLHLCGQLGIECSTSPTHDDLDAGICALTAAVCSESLDNFQLDEKSGEQMPVGYRIMKSHPFGRITFATDSVPFDDWMKDHKASL